MLQAWLGSDQTIDLGQWAMCLGLRKAYLDTLPNRRWAGHLILLDAQQQTQELLRITLDEGRIRLRFLPPDALKITGTPTDDLVALATRVAAAAPSDPPALFTVLMDRCALSEMLIAALADPPRAGVFRTRLAAGYGRHWAVHALTPVGEDLVQRILQNDLWSQPGRWVGLSEGRTLVFHRDNAPTTRRGIRQIDGQIDVLEPAELISLPGAMWVDERFVGEGIDLLDRMLREPPKNALALYAELTSFVRRNYVRLPGNKPLPWLRMLPNLIKGAWPSSKDPVKTAPPPTPAPARITLALYFQFGLSRESDQTMLALEQRCEALFDVLDRYPRVHVTVGWTESALRMLATHRRELLERYASGVRDGRFETVSALDTPPFPVLISHHLLKAQADSWQQTASGEVALPAAGIVPLGQKLSPGWGDALRGYGYRYVALDEAAIRRAYAGFDPARPIAIESWPTAGLHLELSRVLGLTPDAGVLADYLAELAAAFAGQTLAARIDVCRIAHLDWLDAFLQTAQAGRHEFVFLSALAAAQTQGVADLLPDASGLEAWTSSESSRTLNAAFSALWNRWQDICALGDSIRAGEQERVFERDIQKIALNIQKQRQNLCLLGETNNGDEIGLAAEQVEQALDKSHALTRNWMLRLNLSSTLPERALGTLRILEPLDMDRQSDLLTVSLPLPGSISSPQDVAFVDRGMIVPSQWLGVDKGLAQFLLVVDIAAGAAKDLIVLPEGVVSSFEGLDITTNRLCNPTLAVLLDEHGQVTSLQFQGQERICGPGNLVKGYLLELDEHLHCDRAEAEIRVAATGPVRGTVTVRQTLAGDVTLVRHLHLSLFSPLLECVTELHFPNPLTWASKFVVGEFDIIGEQVIWPQPLQAGIGSCPAAQSPPVIFSAQDVVELRKAWQGVRYMVHQASTRTFQFSARPVPGGLRLGLIASMPERTLNPGQLGKQPGLGFPGYTYAGRYTYRYALQPVSPDLEMHAMLYNRPLLWSFYPKT